MRTAVVVDPTFDSIWPFAADRLIEILRMVAEVEFVRLGPGPNRPLPAVLSDPASFQRLIVLGAPLREDDLDLFTALREAFVETLDESNDEWDQVFAKRGVRRVKHGSVGFWGESVAEFALGLTIAALRRIAQTHCAIRASQDAWHHPLQQYSDDPRFASGTVEGKRVRVVGAGNIASRYASFAHHLGADVAAWDPFAMDPAFHRAGARREWHLEKLMVDAEIFAPMVPLTPDTRGLVTADLLRSLPNGCLVVLVTRADIVDMGELRRRVLADELSLAADVFDIEPLSIDDPLLGRHNVVHTPHIAGRTREANLLWAEMLVERFPEYDRLRVEPPSTARAPRA